MSTYTEDFMVWSEHQAALLRRMAAGEAVNEFPDWPNIIEEIESLGRSERHALRRQISRVLEHLIALAASPATDPHRGWKLTIINAQAEMRKLLRDNPSLRRELPNLIADELSSTRKLVRQKMALYDETPTVDLEALSFSEAQVLGDDEQP